MTCSDHAAQTPPSAVLRDDTRETFLLFRSPREVLQTYRMSEVLPLLERAEAAVEQQGLFAVGFLSYEAAPAFDPALRVHPTRGPLPLAFFALHNPPELCAELAPLSPMGPHLPWQPTIDFSSYRHAVERIRHHIAQGDTYQVNYTFPMETPFHGLAWDLFRQLLPAQRAPWAAYLDLGQHALCSLSPELFFHLSRGILTCRPMKGTSPRGRWLEEDNVLAQKLAASEKNRAENVMIVDMLRNDMGHVADLGSVVVRDLCVVERYPTLLQMTSTVTCRTRESRTEILRALFPCASITGAPKVHTMRLLAELETCPRGIYTGAIGYLAPGGHAQFNVAIRTVHVDRQQGLARYSVGSAILWDSDPADEYNECLLKAQMLRKDQDFELLETLRWTPDAGYLLLDEHMQRLSDSATYFVFPLRRLDVLQKLEETATQLAQVPHRVRLRLSQNGLCSVEASCLPTSAQPEPVRLRLAPEPVDRQDVFLYHKTTRRQLYEAAKRACPDCDDVLLWNDRGEVTETCTGNVALALERDGHLVTPPVECGLLRGTYRSWLMTQGRLQEGVVRLEECVLPHRLYVMNSVHGLRQAVLFP